MGSLAVMNSLCPLVHVCALPLGIHLGVQGLGHRVYICSALAATVKWFSKVVTPVYILLFVKEHSSSSTPQPTLDISHSVNGSHSRKGILAHLCLTLKPTLSSVAARYSMFPGDSTGSPPAQLHCTSTWRTSDMA